MLAELKTTAKRSGLALSEVVRDAVKAYLKENVK
jgi:metal-responsive CopG/Arc/MetJ family transcriptional regulator